MGVDPALGGGHAMVAAHLGDKLTVLDARSDRDLMQPEQQIALIGMFAAAYKPSLVIIEFDAQQKGLGNDDRMQQLAQQHGFTIRPHYTRGQKLDEIFGVASMDQSFKKGEIRIPYGDQHAQDRMAPLLHELRAWRPDIPTKNLTQDLVMALWFVHRYWMQIRKAHTAPVQPALRPSWLLPARRIA